MQGDADACRRKKKYLVPPRGLETPPQNTSKTHDFELGGAESGALPLDFDQFEPDLQRVIDAWPTLPEAIRAGILAMIGATGK